nr:hypothetical protein [Candidatus Arsenophonus triatominarum]
MANGIPLSAEKADRFAALLLAASWLEDIARRLNFDYKVCYELYN